MSGRSDPVIAVTGARVAVLLAALLVVAVALGGYLHQRQSSELDRLKEQNHTLLLEKQGTAGVVIALDQVRAEARANERRLQRTIETQARNLETARARLASTETRSATTSSQLATLRAQLAKARAQLAASRKALTTTQAALTAAQKQAGAAAAAPTPAAPTLTAEEQQTKRFCDALGALWWQYPGCRAFYKEH